MGTYGAVVKLAFETIDIIQSVGPKLKLPMLRAGHDIVLGPIWRDIIKPIVDKFAEDSMNDFSTHDVWTDVYSGRSILYIGNIDDKEFPFAGFVVVRVGQGRDTAHIWLAYIDPKYRGTDVMKYGAEFIEKELKGWGVTTISASSQDEHTSAWFKSLGFHLTFQTYRKKIDG